MEKVIAREIFDPHPIEIEFFSKQSNKTTKLVNSSDGFRIDGANRWYDFSFAEPVFVTKLEIISEGYDSWYKFEVEVFHADETFHQERIPVNNNSVSLSMGKLATSFRFKPESRWARTTSILRVVVHGYSLKEFHELEWAIKEIRKRESAVSSSEKNLTALEAAAENARVQIKELTVEVGKLTAQQGELTNKSKVLQEQIVQKEALDKDLQRELETLQETRRSIRTEISTEETKLDNLTKKLRLFPSEIAGFVKQGNRNIWAYVFLGLPFAAIFGVVLWSLFSSAIDLTQLWRKQEGVDVWTIFLTRIPFVLVAIALIEACGFIVGRLVFEIVKINRQRLDFQKLSIIAKDVVTAAAADSELTEAERFAEETKLKMSLLQEHMKSKSNEEYRYSGSAITSAVIGVASRFAGGKNGG